jgi:hypothetical protein
MPLEPPKFVPHGVSRFEVRGQVLVLYSQGPFNAEHIQSLVPEFRRLAVPLQQQGPWATINVISRSMMLTPEALELMRESARWTHDHLGRIAAGYVIGPEVEGRLIMEAGLRASCTDIMPLEIFEDFAAAEAWALEQIAAAAQRSGNRES